MSTPGWRLSMGSIVRKELKLLLKGKGNFFFLMIMPALFIALFGSVYSGAGSKLAVNYVDLDHSAVSQRFLQDIGQVDGVRLKQDPSSVDTQIQKIRDGKLSSLLVIPAGFGVELGKGQTSVQFYRDAATDAASGPIESILNSIAGRYQKQHVVSALVQAGQTPAAAARMVQPPIHIQEIKEAGSNGAGSIILNQIVPGYTVMFVFFIILTIVRSFQGEKESGMLARLRSTPMSPLTYLAGMWIPSIIAVLIQCVVLLGFGHIAYGVQLGNVAAIGLIVLCLAVCGTGIGLAVSLLVRGENQGRGITMLISLGGAAVGGLWLPTQLMPHFAQVIGYFTPQYWAQQGFQDVMLRGAHIADVWQTVVILLAFGVAGLAVALLRFPAYLRSATN